MKNLPHLLCVDDDNKIRELLKIYLTGKNFRVTTAKDSFEAEKYASFFVFDLIILDIMMPKRDGIQFLNYLRKEDTNTPVLMLTANNQLEQKSFSYTSGCDDYLIKPFEPTELLLRINKLLNPRFNKKKSNKKTYFGEFEFDFGTKVLSQNKININLTSSEQIIIEFLSENLNKEITREEIAERIGESINLRSVDVTITRLRKKIVSENNNSFLRTVRGKGYMLVSEYE
ncbi:MAG: response regulator transcription factor [Pseudomonadota bacterium]|nr:response regulator transcription factor [Pseudomonadota bacterium]